VDGVDFRTLQHHHRRGIGISNTTGVVVCWTTLICFLFTSQVVAVKNVSMGVLQREDTGLSMTAET
jgi:hypothetical protein